MFELKNKNKSNKKNKPLKHACAKCVQKFWEMKEEHHIKLFIQEIPMKSNDNCYTCMAVYKGKKIVNRERKKKERKKEKKT